MSRETLKGFISGIVVMMLLFATTLSVFASVGTQNAAITYKNIKVFVNGVQANLKDAKENTVEPFLYNGSTYLPVRAVADAVSMDVYWHNATNSVYLGTVPEGVLQNTNNPPPTPPQATVFSRSNPAPMNASQTIAYKSFSEEYNATVTITELLRGNEAWLKIKEANMFNQEADAGSEYVLVKVNVAVNSVKNDGALSLSQYSQFKAFSSDNSEYKTNSVVKPDPVLEGKVYAGGTKEGYIAFQVSQSDPNPKLLFGGSYDGTGGIWFKLSK